MVQQLPSRDQVKLEETWNLQDLFASEKEYEEAIERLTTAVQTFHDEYVGKMKDASSVVTIVQAYEQVLMQFVPIGAYASLASSVDETNTEAQMRASSFSQLASRLASQLSFVESELATLDESVLQQAIEQEPTLAAYLNEVIAFIPHQLHPEVEKTLKAFGSTFSSPYSLYNTTKLVDMTFEPFQVNDEFFPLSYVSFEGVWDSHPNLEKRREAFRAFSNKLRDYQHTTAKTYDMHIQREKTEASLRKFDSVIDYLLFDQQVDRSMYNRQIDVIMEELAPHMRKYAKLLQRVHGIEKMTFADLKVPLDPNYEPTVSIEQSKQYIFDALSIMGDDYHSMLERAYDERWIDFAQNIGKSTGAFCSSPYGSHPYILISWTGSMEDVFVLAHELGHAGHFYTAHQHQSYFNARPSLYFIEAPSTMNEMLMANHLLKNSTDPQFKRWVISSIVSRTYYHNFVTHLLEAHYQRKVYELVDTGHNVNASLLNKLKKETLEQFWGDDVVIDDDAALTWMRQPHYYMGLYPYTYSAGLTISTAVSQRILKEGEPAVEDWLNVLRAGGTKTPAQLAQMAKVDITTDAPLRETIQFIGSLIDELITLTDEIEQA